MLCTKNEENMAYFTFNANAISPNNAWIMQFQGEVQIDK